MTEDPNAKKCPFGVLLDIVDSFQKMNEQDSSKAKAVQAAEKKCPYCRETIESVAEVCSACGKKQPIDPSKK